MSRLRALFPSRLRRTLLLVLALSLLASPLTAAQQLIDCLSQLNADLVSAQNVDQYDLARQVANKRVLREPIAVVYPHNIQAVQGAVNCSRQAGFPAVARSGGHGYEGYSVQDNSVVVDLARYMGNYTSLGGTSMLADIGAGIRLGPLYYAAWQDGHKAFPAGTCPAVGAGGHLLGGAWGLLARAYGLGCDRIRAVTMVDAQGKVVEANSTHNADLLWASCGGGGGNLGIVTSMRVQMVQPPARVSFAWLSWPTKQLPTLFKMWQSFAPKTDARFTSELYMSADVVELHGLFMGPKTDCDKLLVSSGMLGVPGITYRYYSESDYLTAATIIAGMTEGLPPPKKADPSLLYDPTWAANEAFKAKSYNLQNPASQGAIDAISSALTANPNGWVQLSSFGGAVNSVPWQSTAYSQRGMLYNIQYYVAWNDSALQAPSLAWINGLQAKLDKFIPANSYINYFDANVTGGAAAYYTGAYPRLQGIKRKYDPGNYFNYPGSIAVS